MGNNIQVWRGITAELGIDLSVVNCTLFLERSTSGQSTQKHGQLLGMPDTAIEYAYLLLPIQILLHQASANRMIELLVLLESFQRQLPITTLQRPI
jgi:hypothetical protein